MTEERRNDLGSKIKDGIILFLITSFILSAWATASIGNEKASKLEIRVSVLEAILPTMASDIKEIKDLLKK